MGRHRLFSSSSSSAAASPVRLLQLAVLLVLACTQPCRGAGTEISILRPTPYELLMVDPSEANERNLHDVMLELNFDALVAAHQSSESGGDASTTTMERVERDLSCLTLHVVADGFHTFDFSWPFPLGFFVEMRLGTHVLEASLTGFENNGNDNDKCPTKADNIFAQTPTSRTTFDIMPQGRVLKLAPSPLAPLSVAFPSSSSSSSSRSSAEGLQLGEFRGHRLRLPPGLALDCDDDEILRSNRSSTETSPRPRLLPPIRVVLLGSLHLAGQNLLALEQAKRLRRLCVRDGDNDGGGGAGWRSFNVSYLSMASASGPLMNLLEEEGVPLGRYEVVVTADTIQLLKDRRAKKLAAAGQCGGAECLRDSDSMEPLELLIEALQDASCLQELPACVAAAVGGLVRSLEGADVVSFTNHETMVRNDVTIAECARQGSNHLEERAACFTAGARTPVIRSSSKPRRIDRFVPTSFDSSSIPL